jgi:hypothetical protein
MQLVRSGSSATCSMVRFVETVLKSCRVGIDLFEWWRLPDRAIGLSYLHLS